MTEITRRTAIAAAIAFATFSASQSSAARRSKRLLVIVTSQAEATPSGKPTGLWFSELADPYWTFRDAGLEVEIASIRGGEPPIDPRSLSGERGAGPLVERYRANAEAMKKFSSSAALATVDAANFDALFLAGGHGTMWDFPLSQPLIKAVSRAFRGGRVVAAVCHGPAGLLNASDASGQSILKDRRVTGFTNAEEDAVQLTSIVPFLLEDEMRSKGARFVAGPNFAPHALRDGNLITGQNPRSAEAAARLVVEALADQVKLPR